MSMTKVMVTRAAECVGYVYILVLTHSRHANLFICILNHSKICKKKFSKSNFSEQLVVLRPFHMLFIEHLRICSAFFFFLQFRQIGEMG